MLVSQHYDPWTDRLVFTVEAKQAAIADGEALRILLDAVLGNVSIDVDAAAILSDVLTEQREAGPDRCPACFTLLNPDDTCPSCGTPLLGEVISLAQTL